MQPRPEPEEHQDAGALREIAAKEVAEIAVIVVVLAEGARAFPRRRVRVVPRDVAVHGEEWLSRFARVDERERVRVVRLRPAVSEERKETS